MSTRSLITIGGAVIGSFFGAPQLGFMLGSLIGNVVDPVKVYGPRMTDAQVMTARDGVPIPWGSGRFRVAGTMIACQPGKPTEHKKEESADKGGPKQVSYTYTRTHAVLICEGPIVGVRKIWRNKKLVYDASEAPTRTDEDADSFADIFKAWVGRRGTTKEFSEKIAIYLGDETQLPDSELEALFGVGEVPAHRGTAYMRVLNDDVTETGGAVPQYDFEVMVNGTSSTQAAQYDIYFSHTTGSTVDRVSQFSNTLQPGLAAAADTRGVCLIPGSPYLAVCNYGAGTVTIYHTQTQAVVVTITCGTQPNACCASEDFLYVTDAADDKVRKIGVGTWTVAATSADLGDINPATDNLCITPDGLSLFVAVQNSNSVERLNALTLASVASIGYTAVTRVACSPDGTKVYATNSNASNFRVITVATNAISGTISLAGIGQDIFFDPSGTYAYAVVTNTHEALQRITVATNTAGARVDLTSVTRCGCINTTGTYAFVFSTTGKVIQVIDLVAFTLDATLSATNADCYFAAGRSLP